MNRLELQQLSDERLNDARALLAVKRWSGAYYMAGYALECALKSCVLAYIDRTGIIFEDRQYAQKCWTHNIEELVQQAGLKPDLDRAVGADPNLNGHWLIARNWTEASRYRLVAQLDAEELLNALTNNPDGVLPWVKNFW